MTTRMRAPRARRGPRRALPAEWEAIYNNAEMALPSSGNWETREVLAGVDDKVQSIRGVQLLINPRWGATTVPANAALNVLYGWVKVKRSQGAFDSNDNVTTADMSAALGRRALLLHKSGYLGLNASNQPILEINYGGLTLSENEGLFFCAAQEGSGPSALLVLSLRAIRRTRAAD